jgi:hypothetical protein
MITPLKIIILIIIFGGFMGLLYYIIRKNTGKNTSGSSNALYKWSAGPKEKCSTDCGPGKKYRDVVCKTKDGTVVEDKWCTGTKPSTQEDCNIKPCEWTYSDWDRKCPSCGIDVVQKRTAECLNGNCKDPPLLERPCDISVCDWQNNKWTKCDKPCGSGKQTRSPICKQGKDQCGPALSKSRSCNTEDCNWSPGDWGDLPLSYITKNWKYGMARTIVITGTEDKLKLSGSYLTSAEVQKWNVTTTKAKFLGKKMHNISPAVKGGVKGIQFENYENGTMTVIYTGTDDNKTTEKYTSKD